MLVSMLFFKSLELGRRHFNFGSTWNIPIFSTHTIILKILSVWKRRSFEKALISQAFFKMAYILMQS